jgi:hypothetical protein
MEPADTFSNQREQQCGLVSNPLCDNQLVRYDERLELYLAITLGNSVMVVYEGLQVA